VERGQVVRFGRTPQADVATGDTFMSRVHFAVECGAEVCRIQDLNSRNGTLINGADLSSAVLRDGDRIFAGQTDFVARVEGAPAVSSQHMTTPQTAATVPDVAALMPPTLEDPSEPTPLAPHRPPATPEQPRAAQPPAPAKTDYGTVPVQQVRHGANAPAPKFQPARGETADTSPKGRLVKLLGEETEPLFALFDALHDPRLLELVSVAGDECRPLYEGGRHAPEKIPYLVSLAAGSPLLSALAERGWGGGFGVFLTGRAPLEEIRAHFRQSLMVKTQDGRELFFRFYEPRFLRELLRTGDYAEVAKFFGPVGSYIVEGERPEMLLRFTNRGRRVETEEQPLTPAGR
ncbi:MAG TPA: DUF4123 domain-containing protein, partial [Pyrinomonadaceae bacterium]|nr:DUF4123 domain-containing protein [Pyrinomonadaceae bacterium]